mmetsp:Transcript_42000/g.164562  ORF Transcript_42000/g.164562 Transcript_42000/m.164562 type:complete len:217 (-) Transcript_42000:882-1532(-)
MNNECTSSLLKDDLSKLKKIVNLTIVVSLIRISLSSVLAVDESRVIRNGPGLLGLNSGSSHLELESKLTLTIVRGSEDHEERRPLGDPTAMPQFMPQVEDRLTRLVCVNGLVKGSCAASRIGESPVEVAALRTIGISDIAIATDWSVCANHAHERKLEWAHLLHDSIDSPEVVDLGRERVHWFGISDGEAEFSLLLREALHRGVVLNPFGHRAAVS